MKVLVRYQNKGVYVADWDTYRNGSHLSRLKLYPVLGDINPFFTRKQMVTLLHPNDIVVYPSHIQRQLQQFLSENKFVFNGQLTLNLI